MHPLFNLRNLLAVSLMALTPIAKDNSILNNTSRTTHEPIPISDVKAYYYDKADKTLILPNWPYKNWVTWIADVDKDGKLDMSSFMEYGHVKSELDSLYKEVKEEAEKED